MTQRQRSQIPGSSFIPKDLELINYLSRKNKKGISCRYIPDMDVYEKEPWLLQHVRHFKSKPNEWLYFVTRNKKEDSKRTSRAVGGYTWKTNITEKIKVKGIVVGHKRNLSFSSKSDKVTTGWVMHEFFLHEFDKDVLCRIRFNPDNAQYAPRSESIVIGQPQPPREEAAREDGSLTLVKIANEQQQHQFVPYATIETPQQHVMSQYSNYEMNGWMEQQDFGSCGQFLGAQQQNQFWGQSLGQFVPYDTLETRQGLEQQQKHVMEQHQDFFSCGQFVRDNQQNQSFGLMKQQRNNDYVNMAECMDENLGQNTDLPHLAQAMENQQWNGCFDQVIPYSAQPYHQAMMEQQDSNCSVTTQQGMMEYYQDFSSYAPQCSGENHHAMVPTETQQVLEPQQEENSNGYSRTIETHQDMEQQQDFGFCGQFVGDHQQNQSFGLLEQQQNYDYVNMAECVNENWGQKTDPSHVAQAMENQQEMMEHQDSNFSVTQQGKMEQQENLAQNHHATVPTETQQVLEPQQQENSCFDHNVVENQTTELPCLNQAHKQSCEQATDLPINQDIDEPRRSSTTSSSSHNEVPQQSLREIETLVNFVNEDWFQGLPDMDDMTNFGDEEWAQQLGVNTPEEEAELQAELGNNVSTAALLKYFCPM